MASAGKAAADAASSRTSATSSAEAVERVGLPEHLGGVEHDRRADVAGHDEHDLHVRGVEAQVGDQRLGESLHGELGAAVGGVRDARAERRPEAVHAARVDDVRPRRWRPAAAGTRACSSTRRTSRRRTCAPTRRGRPFTKLPPPPMPALLKSRLTCSVACSAATASRKASTWRSSDTSQTWVRDPRAGGRVASAQRLRLGHVLRRHVADRDVTALGGELRRRARVPCPCRRR